MHVPRLTAAEWKLIAPHLPPTGGPGKPRQDDKAFVSAFCYAAACGCSLQNLPSGYPNPTSLQTRRHRWRQIGAWDRIMGEAAPVVARMRNKYWGLIRAASDTGSPHWKHSSEIFLAKARSRGNRTWGQKAAMPTGAGACPRADRMSVVSLYGAPRKFENSANFQNPFRVPLQ